MAHVKPPGGGLNALLRPVGRVTRLAIEPCSVPPTIWAETAGPAVLEAIMTIASPDIKEAYHITTGHSLVCTLKSDIKDGLKEAGERPGAWTRRLFKASEVVDAAIWYMFLASVGADALVDWTTMAYRVAGCTDITQRGSSDSPQGATVDSSGNGVETGFSWLTDNPLDPAFGASVQVRPGHNWGIFWHVEGVDLARNPVPMDARILDDDTGDVLDHFGGQMGKDGKAGPTIVWQKGTNLGSTIKSYSVYSHGTIATSHNEVFAGSGSYCHVYPRLFGG